jgi:hypothetical protein
MLLAAVAVAAVFALSAVPVASANGCTSGCTSSGSLYIEHYADLVMSFGWMNVVLDFKCTGGLGNVTIEGRQSASQSANGIGTAFGTGTDTANCDGTWRKLDVTVQGSTPWNLGCADVVVALTPPATLADPTPQPITQSTTIQIVD